jgi:hypothetical protein
MGGYCSQSDSGCLKNPHFFHVNSGPVSGATEHEVAFQLLLQLYQIYLRG